MLINDETGLPSESATGDVGCEVQVKLAVATLLQGSLHAALSARANVRGGPGVVDGEVGGLQAERDSHAGVGVVHGGDLVVDHGLRVAALLGRGRDDVDVDGDAGGRGAADLQVGGADFCLLVEL